VNAFTYTFFDRAIEQAKAAESRYLTGHNLRPLEGIPVVIKDLHPVKGEITTCGSRVLEGVREGLHGPVGATFV
jgi:aspartyl-tRNA(Asn)/glutamyl-tRNA(Gln) amidotransferase subunit A